MAKPKKPAKAPSHESPFVNPSMVRELASVLIETGLTEIEFERAGLRLRLQRSGQASGGDRATQHILVASQTEAETKATPAADSEAVDLAAQPGTVTSPMVGTAYLAPAPGAANFIEVGSPVKEGQTILIIEAMKTMNQIHAPRSGRVVHIFVQNAQPVEYGEPLVVIE